jgi:tetratricopeptide (TPR) repeat protein
MTSVTPDDNDEWDRRVATLWAEFDRHEPSAFLVKVQALAGELAADDARALFELACANDSTGRTDVAVPLYREALAIGLTGIRRRRAVIQMASSLRALGSAEESVKLLRTEREAGSDELDDAVIAVLALSLADTGHAREAAGLAIGALARHLPRYNRSMANYARALVEEQAGP